MSLMAFSAAPKFSTPHYLEYIMNNGDEEEIKRVIKTLDHMLFGGIQDQIGGGFHLCTIDPEWKIPHFKRRFTPSRHHRYSSILSDFPTPSVQISYLHLILRLIFFDNNYPDHLCL